MAEKDEYEHAQRTSSKSLCLSCKRCTSLRKVPAPWEHKVPCLILGEWELKVHLPVLLLFQVQKLKKLILKKMSRCGCSEIGETLALLEVLMAWLPTYKTSALISGTL